MLEAVSPAAAQNPAAPTSRRLPWLVYGAVWAALFLVAGLSVEHLPIRRDVVGFWRGFPSNPWLDAWTRWDGGWYKSIAEIGYTFTPGVQSPVAFFPVYPLLMRAVSWLGIPVLGAGILITATSGLFAAVLFHRWSASRLAPRSARAALGVLLLYPFAYYLYGAVYSDALFLLLVLGAFLLLESDHVWLSGLCGAVATATRPVGVALVAGLAVRALERRGFFKDFSLRRIRWKDAGVLLSALGFAAYCAFLWYRFGDPLAFKSTIGSPGWEQPPGPATWLKLVVFKRFAEEPLEWGHASILAHATLTFTALALVPSAFRRFGWGYGVYALVVVAFPAVSTKDFLSMGRYILAAFPCFAAAGDLLAPRPRLLIAGLCLSAVALAVFTSLFARWYYLA